jgi:molybdenum cofactor cytidylyltransferase
VAPLVIDGVLLAAGRSRRFGSPKLLFQFQDRPLVCHALDACVASRLGQIHVVVPGDDERLHETVSVWAGSTAENGRAGGRSRVHLVPAPASEAMIVTIQTGLQAVTSRLGAMIVLGDMPLVTPAIINRLIDAFDPRLGIVVPVCNGAERHPRIIPADLFDEFLALDEGAKGLDVVECHRDRVQRVVVGEPGNFTDIDTVGDLPPS